MPTAAEQLQSFMATQPADVRAGDYDLNTSRGRKLYDAAKSKAAQDQKQWELDNKDTLNSLRAAVKNDTESAGIETATKKRREQTLQKYEGSPDQRFMGAGGLFGGIESYALTKHLPLNRASLIPFALAAAGQGWKAGELYNQMGNPDADPYSEDQRKATANFLASAGVSDLVGMGIQHALVQGERGKERARNELLQNMKLPDTTEPKPVAPPVQTNEYKGLSPTDASKKILRDLGVDQADISHLRGKNVEAIPEAIKSAGDDTVRNVARGFPGVDANEPDPKALRDALKAASTKRLMVNRALGIGAPIAVGIGAAAWPRPTYASDGSGRLVNEPFSAGASRALNAAKELPGEMIRGIPESLREMTPGMQSGAMGVSPEQFEAQEAAKEAAKTAAAERRDARERAIMSQLQRNFPEPRANEVPPAIRTLENAADDDTAGFAKGGTVHPKIAAMTRGLSGIQRSLDADMKRQSARIDNLERAKAKNASNGVRRALSKAHSEREDTIHDIWAVHYLAKHLSDGKIPVRLGMTKQAILALARSRYDRTTGLPHVRRHF
jgi:hypothetical protein